MTTTHPYPPGTRVRHRGDQYPECFGNNTGTIVSSYSRGEHLEYVIELDRPNTPASPTRTEWSSERTLLADDA